LFEKCAKVGNNPAYTLIQTSPVATGGFGGLIPPNKAPSPQN